MRAAAIFGPSSSISQLKPFHTNTAVTWVTELPSTSSDADAILIFGGDGTVHRYLPQLAELQLPVLVVPYGSGNDFARALGLGKIRNSLAAWHKFCSARSNVQAIDLGVITPMMNAPGAGEMLAPQQHYFCCVGGVGLDAEVARRANLLPRWLRAHGGYVLSFLPALSKFAAIDMKISVAQAEGGDEFIAAKPLTVAAFANAPAYGGGMKIAPRARFDDGALDLCLVPHMSKFKLCCLFPTVYFGRHLSVPGVEYFQTQRVRLETETPLDVYADGEFVCRTPVEVSVARAALRVITL